MQFNQNKVRETFALLVATLIAGFAALTAKADPLLAPIDSTFGVSGYARVFTEWSDTRVVRGIYASTTGEHYVLGAGVLRLESSGAVSTTWGIKGAALIDRPVEIWAAAPAPSQGLYLSGAEGSRGLISRLRNDGSLDTTFAGSGSWRDTTVAGTTAYYHIDSDSQFQSVVAATLPYGDGILRVVKLTSAGAIDGVFGAREVNVPEFGGEKSIKGIALDDQNRVSIWMNSRGTTNATSVALVVRLTAHGVLDSGFGNGGVRTFPGEIFYGDTVTQSRQKLAVTCVASCSVGADFKVRLFESNGSDTPAFAVRNLPALRDFHSLRGPAYADPEGAVYVDLVDYSSQRGARIRLLSNGALDETLGEAGYGYVGLRALSEVSALLPRSSSNIALAITSDSRSTHATKYAATGSVDTAYGIGGSLPLRFSELYAIINRVETLSDGGYVAVGLGYLNIDEYAPKPIGFISRLDSMGKPMVGFGDGGRRIVDFGISALAVTDDGFAYVAGGNKLARIALSSGNIDRAFATNGLLTLHESVSIADIKLDRKSRLILVGSSDPSVRKTYVARVLANGTMDAAFDGSFSSGKPGSFMRVAIHRDGYVLGGLYGGWFRSWQAPVVARISESGGADSNFFSQLIPPTPIALPVGFALFAPSSFPVSAIAVDPAGNILVGTGLASDVRRLTPSGSIDTTFGSAGSLSLSAPGAIEVSLDGKLVVATGVRPFSAAPITQTVALIDVNGGAVLEIAPAKTLEEPAPLSYPDSPWTALAVRANGEAVLGGRHLGYAALTRVKFSPSGCKLDLDGDGVVSGFTDGVLLSRALAGVSVGSLTKGVLGENASRFRASSLADFAERLRTSGSLNLDGETPDVGESNIAVLLRIMSGFTESAVTEGVTASTAVRSNYAAIRDYLRAQCGY
jgi:uncharacterized delta-60 repeat protein